MSKSVADLNEERRNKKAKHSDFPVGTAVKIVCACQDFHFWYGETGIVTKNKGGGSYLGITVKLDVPRTYEGDGQWPPNCKTWTLTEFNFNPEDLRRRYKKRKSFWKRFFKK